MPKDPTFQFLSDLRDTAEEFISDPSHRIDQKALFNRWSAVLTELTNELNKWAKTDLKITYQEAVKSVINTADQLGIAHRSNLASSMFTSHDSAYDLLKSDALKAYQKIKPGALESMQRKIREMVVEASQSTFRTADTITRRSLMQDVMNKLADEGLEAVKYSNGSRMSLRGYSEMVARTTINEAKREASMNTQKQMGQDLVRMDVHFPTCKYCLRWQGRILSISGGSAKYPSVADAKAGNALHPNCSHSLNPYYEDVSAESLNVRNRLDKAENKRRYEIQMNQRRLERQVRKWKKRKNVAMSDNVKRKATQKIRSYQKELRELTGEFDFLRRKGEREILY